MGEKLPEDRTVSKKPIWVYKQTKSRSKLHIPGMYGGSIKKHAMSE